MHDPPRPMSVHETPATRSIGKSEKNTLMTPLKEMENQSDIIACRQGCDNEY